MFWVVAIMLYQHETTRFDTIGTVFTVSVLVPFALSSMIYMRDQFDRDGLFYIMLVLQALGLQMRAAILSAVFSAGTSSLRRSVLTKP